MAKLELKIPPLVVAALCALLMRLTEQLFAGMDTFDRGASVQGAIGPVRLILALACAGAGVAFALSGATRLIGAKTTVNTTDPGATSVLVMEAPTACPDIPCT